MASLFCDTSQCNPSAFVFWLASCIWFEGLPILMKVLPDGFGGFAIDDGGERFGRGLLNVAQAAEVREQALAGLRAHAGNVQKFRISISNCAPLAMIADGKAMALVANELHEMEHRRTAVEHDGFVFIAVDVNNFFSAIHCVAADAADPIRRPAGTCKKQYSWC